MYTYIAKQIPNLSSKLMLPANGPLFFKLQIYFQSCVVLEFNAEVGGTINRDVIDLAARTDMIAALRSRI